MFRLGYETGVNAARALGELVRGGPYPSVLSVGYLPGEMLDVTVEARAPGPESFSIWMDGAGVHCATRDMYAFAICAITPCELQVDVIDRTGAMRLAARLVLRYELRDRMLAMAPLDIEGWDPSGEQFVDGFTTALEAEREFDAIETKAPGPSFGLRELAITTGTTLAELLTNQQWTGRMLIWHEPGEVGFRIDGDSGSQLPLSSVEIEADSDGISVRIPNAAEGGRCSSMSMSIETAGRGLRWRMCHGGDVTDAAADLFIRGIRTGLGPEIHARYDAFGKPPEEL